MLSELIIWLNLPFQSRLAPDVSAVGSHMIAADCLWYHHPYTAVGPAGHSPAHYSKQINYLLTSTYQ